MPETTIVINGRTLSAAEAATISVAVSSYLLGQSTVVLADGDVAAQSIRDGHARNCWTILEMLKEEKVS